MPLKQITPPEIEPIKRDEAKDHLRVDGNADDLLVDALIRAAREHCEQYTGRSLISTRWRYTLDGFPCDGTIRLPMSPLIAVQSMTYDDADGDSQTLDASAYRVDDASEPPRVRAAYDTSWPSTRDHMNSVTVLFDAGYGITAESVPFALKAGMLLLVGQLYESRGEGAKRVEIPLAVMSLWEPFRYQVML